MTPFTERTLVLLKPDAVRRGLTGRIITRFEEAGLAVLALKVVRPTADFARGHYPTTDAQLQQMGNKTLATYAELGIDPKSEFGTDDSIAIGRIVHEWNAEFLSSGPVVAIVLEGVHAIKKVRAICGSTMPKDAAMGSIRGDFSSASPAVSNLLKTAVHNLVHASDNENDPNEPRREIDYWFTSDEIVDYNLSVAEVMF